MKKGFTLIEMIAVIGIIAIMSLLVLPTIINQVAEKKTDLSETTKKLIYEATELYFSDNMVTYPKVIRKTYCVRLEELIKDGYLKENILDAQTGKEIDTSLYVTTTINDYNDYDNFDIVEKCEA